MTMQEKQNAIFETLKEYLCKTELSKVELTLSNDDKCFLVYFEGTHIFNLREYEMEDKLCDTYAYIIYRFFRVYYQ